MESAWSTGLNYEAPSLAAGLRIVPNEISLTEMYWDTPVVIELTQCYSRGVFVDCRQIDNAIVN